MRSGKSYFDITLFKRTVTRWWPIWASYLVVCLFVMPIRLALFDPPYRGVAYEVGDLVNLAVVLSIAYGPICAMAVLSHLYSPRSANFYGALPIKRQGIFLTQYLAGFAFSLVPNVAVSLLASVIIFVRDKVGVVALLGWLGVATVSMFFFYTFAILCGMFAGHVLALPVFYGVFNCVAALLFLLMEHVLEEAYYGFMGLPGWLETTVIWLTPAVRCFDIAWQGGETVSSIGLDSTSILTLTVYGGVAVVMLILAYLLYKGRRTESAGDVVAVSHMKPVFKYGVAVCSGLFLGYITSFITGGLPVLVVIWTVIGYFAAQMILDKSFRVFGKWHGALVVGIVMALFMCVVSFDLTGFENRIPELEDVRSVEVERLSSSYGLGDSADWVHFSVTDKEEIANIIALHKAAVAQRDETFGDEVAGAVLGYVQINFTYETRSGSMTRSYGIRVSSEDVNTEGTSAWALERIFNDKDLWWRIYGFDRAREYIDSGRLPDMMYDYVWNDPEDEDAPEKQFASLENGGTIEITGYANINDVLNAVTWDFEAGNLCRRTVTKPWSNVDRSLTLYFGPTSIKEAYDNASWSLTISLPPTASHTLETIYRILPEMDYLQQFEEDTRIDEDIAKD